MYCRFIFSACVCLLVVSSAFAQNPHNNKMGDDCMKRGDYAKAASFYKKAADANINDVLAKEKLGKALVALGDYQSAEAVYQLLATSPMASDTNKFYYAQMLRTNHKYEVAAINYKAYFDLHPNDPLAGEFRNFSEKLKALQQADNHYQLTNIPENTKGSDEGPTFCVYNFCFTSNGNSSGSKNGNYDLYILHGGNPANREPEKIKGKANWSLNENAAAFTNDGREMIFTRSNNHKSIDKGYKLGLYHADYDSVGKKWINVKPLSFSDNNYNYMQPALSKDGSKLLFSSDKPDGLGETDIYMVVKQGNSWGAPVNLGAGVNTIGREETPFIASDGSLYFASDSRMGLGGLDIYAATATDSTWGNASNVGIPINSAFDDFGYVNDPTSHSGYIVSNRPGGMGKNDIYHFTPSNDLLSASGALTNNINSPRKIIELNINVSQGNDKLQNATAVLFNPATGVKIEHVSDIDGYVKFEAEPNQEYVLKVFKTDMQQGGYEKFVRPISTLGLKPGQVLREDAQLIYHENMEAAMGTEMSSAKVQSGSPNMAGLPTIYFGTGSYTLDATSKKKLDEVVKLMKQNPSVEMEISSNTDASGDLRSNMALSAKRSLACLNYLVTQGINKGRFIAVGYGDKMPVNNCIKVSNCTDVEKAKNRRTEFKIIKN